ncbi:protein mono-ADP-ribosyltransferase PARP12-like [Eucyclogobius newberryi]|uniref:protein mono-ADP-ribosyltransferase PARP12-like n=1 Tax=Eucyclogobius newberryi TaxID=166745 RepID=UPI003B5B637B
MDTVILKHILSAQGSVDRAELECNLGDASLIAQIVDATDQLVACWSSGAARVVARSRARLCRAQECPGCGGLHLCKNLLLSGACHSLQSRRGCSFSHDLRSEYNVEVLMKFGLESLSRTELRLLLLQSDNTLLPQICHDYNNPCGCWVECPRLHVCERHLSGGGPCCCTRAHDFTATQPLRLLREKNIPTDLFKVLKSVYANREALRLADKAKGDDDGDSSDTDRDAIGDAAPDCAGACDSDSSSTVSATQNQSGRRGGQKKTRGGKGRTRNKQADAGVELDEPECQAPMTDVICMFFIRGHCQHEDRCLNVHDDLPYRWQVKHGGFWVSMAENERIEEDFCDPQKTSSATCPSVCFETMRSGQSRVRRLSTLNSVVKPNYSHTTDWLWHWEDDSGQWHQYAQSKHRLIRVTSKQLEETYVKKEDARTFTAGSQLHRLSFRDMIERNLTDGGERRVRRRPRFVSAADVRTKRYGSLARIHAAGPRSAVHVCANNRNNFDKRMFNHTVNVWIKITRAGFNKRVPVKIDFADELNVGRAVSNDCLRHNRVIKSIIASFVLYIVYTEILSFIFNKFTLGVLQTVDRNNDHKITARTRGNCDADVKLYTFDANRIWTESDESAFNRFDAIADNNRRNKTADGGALYKCDVVREITHELRPEAGSRRTNARRDVINARRDVVINARRDVINARRDVINARRDVVNERRDVVSARRDVVNERRDVVNARGKVTKGVSAARSRPNVCPQCVACDRVSHERHNPARNRHKKQRL